MTKFTVIEIKNNPQFHTEIISIGMFLSISSMHKHKNFLKAKQNG